MSTAHMRQHNAQVRHMQGWSNWAPHIQQRGEGGGGPHGKATRLVDDLSAEGAGSKNRTITPATTSTTPVRQLLAPLTRKRHHKGNAMHAVRSFGCRQILEP